MNQFQNEQTFCEQGAVSIGTMASMPDQRDPSPRSLIDDIPFPGEISQPKDNLPSFQFLDYMQGSKGADKKPFLIQAPSSSSANEKKSYKKAMSLKTQKVKVINNNHVLTLDKILPTGPNESPMTPAYPNSGAVSDKGSLIPKLGTISNFWASPQDVDSYQNTPTIRTPPKKGQVTDRWATDTLGSDDDRTDRLWRLQNSASKRERKSSFVPERDDTDFQSYTERRREPDDAKSTQNLIKINDAGREYTEHEQQYQEAAGRHNNARSSPRAQRRVRQAAQARQNNDNGTTNDDVTPPILILPNDQHPDAVQVDGPSAEPADQQPVQNEAESSNTEESRLLNSKLFLKRCFGFFVGSSIIWLCVRLMVSGKASFNAVFGACFGYLLYFAAESVVRGATLKRETWRKREEALNVCDAISAMIFLGIMELRMVGQLSSSMAAFVPFIINALIYLLSSSAPNRIKHRSIGLKICYAFQTFFLSTKYDNVINFDWRLSFGITWVCFGVLGLYLIAYGLIFVLAVVFGLFKQRLFEDIGIILQYIGLIWYLLFYGLSVVGFATLIGIGRAYEDSEGFDILQLAATMGLIINFVLAIYTLIAFQSLAKFMEIFSRIEGNSAAVQSPQEIKDGGKTISLEVQKKESYFVMLSSTYFLPLNSNIVSKNEEKLRKIKDLVLGFRLWKPKPNREESMHQADDAVPVDIKVLKEYKQALDERFTKIVGHHHHEEIDSCKALRAPKKLFTQKLEHPLKPSHQPKDVSSDNIEAIKSSRRMNLSADDINFKEIVGSKENEVSNRQDNLCYLCYDSPPNAVLMKCGHGGICYECASALVQKKNECMECRRPVEMIYKVDPNPKMKDIIKGVEVSKVTLS